MRGLALVLCGIYRVVPGLRLGILVIRFEAA